MEKGMVYIVGAGPGAADLITVKGVKAIRRADVIIYDRLVNRELLEYAREDAEKIYCGKQPGYHAMKQETIHHFLIKHALKGKIVTRLKGGDPFVFGRGGEEAEALAEAGIGYEIVPGITSGIAAPAYAGIPLTHRECGGSFTVVTGHRSAENKAEDWRMLATGADTLVIYMGMANLERICAGLITYGRDEHTPAALIQWGTTGEQRTLAGTLRTIADMAVSAGMTNPAIIIVGEVVKLRDKLKWFETGNGRPSSAKEAMAEFAEYLEGR